MRKREEAKRQGSGNNESVICLHQNGNTSCYKFVTPPTQYTWCFEYVGYWTSINKQETTVPFQYKVMSWILLDSTGRYNRQTQSTHTSGKYFVQLGLLMALLWLPRCSPDGGCGKLGIYRVIRGYHFIRWKWPASSRILLSTTLEFRQYSLSIKVLTWKPFSSQ